KDAQKRAGGWHRLYSADNGMMTRSEDTTPAYDTCLNAASAAIDVYNVAFRMFGFAVTQWVLSDSGWLLTTGILHETGTLYLFLKTT
ncbi:DsbC family protein, partial [Salmonella enterica subsp. enterica serovar Weltevreden]|nr:DsbC family protein [Salmonella enterica subsp. enterica serovar Weltevreden]